jgi:hypothetical protein
MRIRHFLGINRSTLIHIKNLTNERGRDIHRNQQGEKEKATSCEKERPRRIGVLQQKVVQTKVTHTATRSAMLATRIDCGSCKLRNMSVIGFGMLTVMFLRSED